ncbi:protease SohB [Pseudomonas mosselii]|uniref:protease SohB n=1 Tax=Pseudomonas mosselii TaxID=78327 RepID=UPI0021DAD9AC|nr:protease SohB [Pseudomonas mosselii]MCU9527559.1 protease SohB [Pseudomonas mosselii]MCU9534872.1 protease SohB [Pseudomonas mosselii]MCU9542375.1 protease SohB [Pseudomonas mosselii]MCU9546712.1 protease SohB [Pseudomonas mosselii]
MSTFLLNYTEFLAKAITVVLVFVAMLLVFAGMRSSGGKGKSREGKLSASSLNKFYENLTRTVTDLTMSKEERKAADKAQKKADKAAGARPKVFVLDFEGDPSASAVESLRHEVTALLAGANASQDEVVLRLGSPGGYVSAYGLAASQLQRITSAQIPLTVCIDEIAASGGYMMACVADKIIAAPFALVGSIGVVAELPNVNRLLKKIDVDYNVYTAGESKRTVSVFGENTDAAREKFLEQLTRVHALFKAHVTKHRPQVEIDKIATGEAWHANESLALNLVDDLMTSDEYLATKAKGAELIHLEFARPKTSALRKLISGSATTGLEQHLPRFLALFTKTH